MGLPKFLLGVFLALLSLTAWAGEEPDIVLRGQLGGKDHQTYIELPFAVPAGTQRISVMFEYTGREQKTTVDLGLIGPDGMLGHDGFRGWSGGNKQQFTVAATDATPSYQPGPITPGRWRLLLGIPNVRSGAKDSYIARIWLSKENAPWEPQALNPPLRKQAGWYRGDLHMHDAHSDGSCTSGAGKKVPCPLFLTVQKAAQLGLDFVAITDHNTVSQTSAMRELQPYFDQLLLIPGREITTFSGHANFFGPLAPIDFRVGSPSVKDWNQLLHSLTGLQGIVSVNHPIRPSDERCMGCGWTPAPAVDPGLIQAVEVVNGMDADTPYSGIPFWESLLNAGQRITAIGGSDNHNATQDESGVGGGRLGLPATVIYANALAIPDLLNGIRSGKVFVDVQGSRERLLTWEGKQASQTAEMGGSLRAPHGTEVTFTAGTRNLGGLWLEVIVDGKPMTTRADALIRTKHEDWTYRWRSDGKRHWLRLNVRDGQGKLQLIGNPIYVNPGR